MKRNLLVLLVVAAGVFICQGQEYDGCGCPDSWIRFNGSCYWVTYHQGKHFSDAQRACIGMRASLVHVNNAGENNFLKSYLSRMKNNNYWIGLDDRDIEGIWTYVDTEELIDFTDWSPGQPDSWHAHNEDCALFYYPHGYKWDDGPCEQNLDYICEMKLPESSPVDIIG